MGMKVLIVGGGGREHAIATCVAKSPKVDKIYCAPGNAGIGQIAECVPIGAMEFDKIVAFAKEQAIDLTIVGMDDPLVGGLVDALEAEGLRAFGPRKNAAILEGSKAFCKDLMKKYNIPTAAYENFDNAEEAIKYLKEQTSFPIVYDTFSTPMASITTVSSFASFASRLYWNISLSRRIRQTRTLCLYTLVCFRYSINFSIFDKYIACSDKIKSNIFLFTLIM